MHAVSLTKLTAKGLKFAIFFVPWRKILPKLVLNLNGFFLEDQVFKKMAISLIFSLLYYILGLFFKIYKYL